MGGAGAESRRLRFEHGTILVDDRNNPIATIQAHVSRKQNPSHVAEVGMASKSDCELKEWKESSVEAANDGDLL